MEQDQWAPAMSQSSFDRSWEEEEALYQKPNAVLLPHTDRNLGGLYIGCLYIAERLKNRDLYGHIGAIVSIGVSLNKDLNGDPITKPGQHPFSAAGYPELLPDVSYHFVDIDDTTRCNIKAHFEPCTAFIDKHRKQGISVYVHCAAGVSRSASIVIAYLMKAFNMSYANAFSQLKACRPIIDPNLGFRKQLKVYEEELQMRGLMERYVKMKKTEGHGDSLV